MAGFADGAGGAASFNRPHGIAINASGFLFVADWFNHRVRLVAPGGATTTLAGSGSPAYANGVGAAASFSQPRGLAIDANGTIFVTDSGSQRVRKVTPGGGVSLLAGSGAASFLDATGAAAAFSSPVSAAAALNGTVYIADYGNNRIRRVTSGGVVTTLAGSAVGALVDGSGTSACFRGPHGVAVGMDGNVVVAEYGSHAIRQVTPGGVVTTLAGNGMAGSADGIGADARFKGPSALAIDSSGAIFVLDTLNHRLRKLTCVPCPASYFCPSAQGAPVLCPAGSFCPLSSTSPTPCPAGTFSKRAGAAACEACPGGHFCPAGTASWARLNCGRGNYCPDGAALPLPCPLQVPPPPAASWSEHPLGAQGPAFLTETAACLNHCFWNITSGNGKVSNC
jgi:sugar lactone lactonase YvrE